MNITAIQTLAVTVVTIIGIIVLIALNKVTENAGLPVIVALAGVHLGAAVSGPTTVTPAAPASTDTVPVRPVA